MDDPGVDDLGQEEKAVSYHAYPVWEAPTLPSTALLQEGTLAGTLVDIQVGTPVGIRLGTLQTLDLPSDLL